MFDNDVSHPDVLASFLHNYILVILKNFEKRTFKIKNIENKDYIFTLPLYFARK